MSTKRRHSGGFTLIEVVIALGIAASSLMLLLSSNQDSLRRSLRSRQSSTLETQAESKLSEILCGAEQGTSGVLEGGVGLQWHLSTSPAEIEELKGLERLTLQISGDHGPAKSISILRYNAKSVNK